MNMLMHTTNYTNTLILPSPDCPVMSPVVPHTAGTVATLQYRQLAERPHGLTSDEVIFAVFAERKGIDAASLEDARAAFFSVGQPCLRASPLVKTYGWALYHDMDGRVALVDPTSEGFRRLSADAGVAKLSGMRSSRA